MSETIILETERLRLSTWTETAVDEVHRLHADPEVARYLDPQGRPYDRAKAEARVAEWRHDFAERGLGKQRLTRKADGVFVGRAGFSTFKDGPPEIGYSFAREHWGQGYASEIAAALLDWLFTTRGEPLAIGYTHVDNLASRRVLEKIGMRPTHQDVLNSMPHQFYRKDRPAS